MRWAILFSVGSIFLTQGLVITSFAPVSIQVTQAYSLSSTLMVNMCPMAFALLSPPSDFLAVYLFSNYRTDHVLRVASLISFIGAMVRMVAINTGEFLPILIGTLMMASVSSIFLNSQIIIANKWFNDKERALAMAVLNVLGPVGQVASFALAGFVYGDVTSLDLPQEQINETVREGTETMLLYQNIPYIVFFILFQLIIRDKPDTPPSAVAAAPPSEDSFCEAFSTMWANKNFMLLAVTYAIIYGVYCTIGAMMSNLLNPFGYGPG